MLLKFLLFAAVVAGLVDRQDVHLFQVSFDLVALGPVLEKKAVTN